LPKHTGEKIKTSAYIYSRFTPERQQTFSKIESVQWASMDGDDSVAENHKARVAAFSFAPIEQGTDATGATDQAAEPVILSEPEQERVETVVPDMVVGTDYVINESMARANEILKDADGEAAAILADAHAKAEQLLEQARAAGHKEGYDDGLAQGKKTAEAEFQSTMSSRVDAGLTEVKELLAELENQKQRLVREYMGELRDLSVTIAEKIIHKDLREYADTIEKIILAATERSKNQQWVKINLARHDADLLVQADIDIAESLKHISGNVTVTVMDNSQPGDCIIEFPDQIIDAGVKTQLDNIREMISTQDMDQEASL
jgi:flagellar assembly protein FliH